MKLLMITSRNIDKKGGENALIVGRHSAIYRKWGVETDVVFIHKSYDQTESLGAGVTLLPTRRAEIFNTIKTLILSKAYQGIVISGFDSVKLNEMLVELKKETPFVIVVDIHATIREIYEYCIPDLYHILGTRYLYLKKKRAFNHTLKTVDYAFVVSDESVEETNSFCKKNHIQYMKVRCGCNASLDVEKYFADRQATRQELGIADDTLAFVYSGSKDRWQKYAETVALFEQIAANNDNCKFAFYMNLNDEDKAELARRLGEDRVIVRWVKPEQMLRDLAGYDVGMLMRDKVWTNKVAFPNKFSDYIHSGLALVMTDAIREPYRIAKAYELDVLSGKEMKENGFCETFMAKRIQALPQYIAQCKHAVDTELMYSNQVASECAAFVEQLQKIEIGGQNG